MVVLDRPWSRETDALADSLSVRVEEGLSPREAKQRLKEYGLNRLAQKEGRSVWSILAGQFANLIVGLLAAAGGVALAFGEITEALAIAAAILINAGIGFATELSAVRSMAALHALTKVPARVRRGGKVRQIDAERLVPGDVVILEGGDLVGADLRLVEANQLSLDEAALTGESIPMTKSSEPAAAEAELAERTSMAFKGTAVTQGSGAGLVVATGEATELGRISQLVEEAESGQSPLQERLNRLGYRLVWVTLGIAGIIGLGGLLPGADLMLIVITAISLAVAAIPEGLPIVATIALARGMWRMARRNALINQLSAVETLGATGVICTDKTGTLTEASMHVERLVLAGNDEAGPEGAAVELDPESGFSQEGRGVDPGADDRLRRALEVAALCNNAELGEDDQGVGDPLEVGLLRAARRAGMERPALLEEYPEEREVAFSVETNMMATFHRQGQGWLVAVKGAPEAVLKACLRQGLPGEGERDLDDELRRRWQERNQELAARGLRVLALAVGRASDPEAEPYQDLNLLGLVGLWDPPRRDAAEAVAACRRAGIRVVMITGDQPATARFVAVELGIIEPDDDGVILGRDLVPPEELDQAGREKLLAARVFARVSPEQKLDLIALHQEAGNVVAMTGDGVNDAPALKKADIGVAMGQRGTQVAREAADMILRDDALSTIVAAVAQGRAIFAGIRRFILFLLSGNTAEIMVVALAVLVGAELPILPLQILYLNMIGDAFPALALGMGPGTSRELEEPPRRRSEPILTRAHWLAIIGYGALIAGPVLGSLALAHAWLGLEGDAAVTISFLTLAFARLWHVFNMRDNASGLLVNEVSRNWMVWAALAICVGLLLAGIYLPVLSGVLRLLPPSLSGWTLILGMSLAPLLLGQLIKEMRATDAAD